MRGLRCERDILKGIRHQRRDGTMEGGRKAGGVAAPRNSARPPLSSSIVTLYEHPVSTRTKLRLGRESFGRAAVSVSKCQYMFKFPLTRAACTPSSTAIEKWRGKPKATATKPYGLISRPGVGHVGLRYGEGKSRKTTETTESSSTAFQGRREQRSRLGRVPALPRH